MKNKMIILIIILGALLASCNIKSEIFYIVKFYDFNDNIVKIEQVKQFESATAPALVEVEGYVFKGWNQDYSFIVQDLEVKPIYEIKKEKEYSVSFYAGGIEISTQVIKKGDNAIEPTIPTLASHNFIRWDKDFTNIQSNLKINAIFERVAYVSYLEDFSYSIINPITPVVEKIDKENPYITFTNIFNGGYRGADQIHYYDRLNEIKRNVYGFEVAINNEGIVIDKGTLVEMPLEGFVLSGHSSTATQLQNKINIGDLVIYNDIGKTATIYRDKQNSQIISLYIKIQDIINKVNQAREDFKAIDYILINERTNKIINIYNSLIDSFDSSLVSTAEKLLLDVEFLLLENRPVQTKAVWHYPLKSGTYYERNLSEVKILLDEYYKMGINRIYLNTNFNGRSIYRSDYLTQSLANNYKYEGYKDYLECFVEEAHKRGISVVAWTNTLIAGDGADNTFYSSKGWILKGYNNEDNFNGMYFVDISNLEVQVFLKNVYYELADNYNLDGIEFDFIRYPNSNIYSSVLNPSNIKDSGYTESFINAFKAKYNFDGDLKVALLNDNTLRSNWISFKTDLLNDFVKDLTQTIKSANSNISISAAVMPDINTAKNVYFQNWDFWIDNGWIDSLEPMIYSGDSDYVIDSLKKMLDVVNGRADIIVGIFPEGSGLDAAANANQIDRLAEFNVGWSKFSSKTIFNHHSFKDSLGLINYSRTVQKNDSKEEILSSYILDLKEKVNDYYIYVCDDFQLLQNILKSYDLNDITDYLEYLSQIKSEITNISNSVIRDRLLKNNEFIYSLLNV